MADSNQLQSFSGQRRDPFPETRWSLVVAATGKDEPTATRALDELCEIYWFPVYCFFRGREESPADAEDLTQDFFATLIRRKSLDMVSPSAGKLRAFLLAAAKNFLTSAHRKKRALKRGGGQQPIPIDIKLAEEQLAIDPPDPAAAPDIEFDRVWVRTVFGRVIEMLEADYRKAGKETLFAELRPWFEPDSGDPPYRELAKKLGMSVGSLRVAMFRLRQRYNSLFKQEIAETLSDQADLESEIDHLVVLFEQ